MVKIAKVEPFFLRYRYPAHLAYRFAAGLVENLDAALIRVTADNGEYGLGGVTFGTHTYEPVLGVTAHFNRVLEGLPAREINRTWEVMYQNSRFWNRYGIGIAVMGGINMAMYDLLGKLLDLPVYQLLGGLARSRIRVYASNGLFTTAEPLIADARRAQASGFDAYKLRVTDPRTVGPIVRAFREALGREMDVMVDAGEAGGAVPWSLSISQKIAKELEPFEPMWLAEPVRVENLDGYVEMRQATTINIAGAESLPTAYAFRPYLERGAFDVVQFDIATSGFTEGARIASLAAVHEKPLAIHSWGWGPVGHHVEPGVSRFIPSTLPAAPPSGRRPAVAVPPRASPSGCPARSSHRRRPSRARAPGPRRARATVAARTRSVYS